MPVQTTLTVISGANTGDILSLEPNSCRLLGRHLSDNETVLMDLDGNRQLDETANQLLATQLEQSHDTPSDAELLPSHMLRGPDIILADDSISRAHVMIFVDDHGAGVVDLASTNGTHINQQRIGAQRLSHGDSILIGQTTLTINLTVI